MPAQVGGKSYRSAWGQNKKEAEQRAACNALLEMNGEEAKFNDE
ncbi:MAG: ribonuclease-3 [Pirellulaceae bacterium]